MAITSHKYWDSYVANDHEKANVSKGEYNYQLMSYLNFISRKCIIRLTNRKLLSSQNILEFHVNSKVHLGTDKQEIEQCEIRKNYITEQIDWLEGCWV